MLEKGMLSVFTFVIVSLAPWLWGLATTVNAASSVSQHGITWTFSQDQRVGHFANGDWWVVGPVTITSINPPAATGHGLDINGTMVNPVYNTTGSPSWAPIQAWDERIDWKSGCSGSYNSTLNIAKQLPYTAKAGDSIMSAKSFPEDASGNDQQLEAIAILTVVAIAPPVGSFRPPYIKGADKTVRWNKSQLKYDRLKKLTPVQGTPTFAEMEPLFEKAVITASPGYSSNYLIPKTHDYPEYGRSVSHKVSAAVLLLNLNYSDAQKETLLIRMVQRGIDLYGVVSVGGVWWGAGGHHHGRKLPVAFAGWMLNDADIIAKAGYKAYQEDAQHWYVTQTDVDLNTTNPTYSWQTRTQYNVQRVAGGEEPQAMYTTSMIGIPEWSSEHNSQAYTAGSQWNADYRQVVGVSLIGSVLAARIMELQPVWNSPETFDYYDKFWKIEALQLGNISYGINSIQPFIAEMWKAYREGGSVIITPPVVTFIIGDHIETTVITNVRDIGSLSGTLLGTQTKGSIGMIIGGPIVVDKITWWQVNFVNGAVGWVENDIFIKSTSNSTKPLSPTGLKVVK